MPSLGFSCYMTLAQRVKVPAWYMSGRHGDFKLGVLGCTMDLAVRVPSHQMIPRPHPLPTLDMSTRQLGEALGPQGYGSSLK